MNDYATFDAVGLADLVRRREVSARDLLHAAIMAIERSDPSLNAVVQKHYDFAERAIENGLPSGRFQGVPFVLKDLDLFLAGTPLTSGSRLFADQIADRDSTLVSRYKAAGLVILGKTNSAEMGLSFTTEPAAYGPSLNPWDRTTSPGGSSGGSAAAVAAGMVPMAHATDGGGSIRQPAALAGLFGLKPSRGRTPPGPMASEIFFGMSVNHAITRSVRDSAALLDATLAPEAGALHTLPLPSVPYESAAATDPPILRIALQTEPFGGTLVDPACRAAVLDTASLCESLGHTVEEARPALEDVAFPAIFRRLAGALTAAFVDSWAKRHGIAQPLDLIEPTHAAWVEEGRRCTASALIDALGRIHAIGRAYADFFTRYDVILSPVIATSPLPLGLFETRSGDLDALISRFQQHAPFTFPYNAASCPAMSVPTGIAEGRPQSAQFAAALGREDILFGLAGQIERARPWAGWKAQA